MKPVLSWFIYPCLVSGGLVFVYQAMRHGFAPVVALGGLQIMLMVIIFALEQLMPEHESWNVSKNDVATDAIFLIVSGLVISASTRALVFRGVPSLSLWPVRWPLYLQVALALAIADLGSYGTHVIEHKMRWIWPIHAPHHSAQRLYFLNATRMHPIDQASTVLFLVLPLALLGVPLNVLIFFDAFAMVHLTLQHSNIRLRHGVLSHVIATAEFHRWHHSKLRAESEGNYASFVSLWDHVFRTFRMPAHLPPPEAVGLYEDQSTDAALPTTFGGQLLAPFRLWKALATTTRTSRERTDP